MDLDIANIFAKVEAIGGVADCFCHGDGKIWDGARAGIDEAKAAVFDAESGNGGGPVREGCILIEEGLHERIDATIDALN